MKKYGIIGLAVAMGLMGTACTKTTYITESAGVESETPRTTSTISVSGEGKLSVAPDICSFSFSIEREGMDAAALQKENTEAVNQILRLLKDAGVKEEQLQSSDYSLYQRYDYELQDYNGYSISQMITVSGQPIESAGALITLVGQNGATNINGNSFDISEREEAYQEALSKAVDDAKAHAEVIAAASGMQLGDVISVTELGTEAGYYPMNKSYAIGNTAMAMEEDVSLEAGQQEVQAKVSVLFEMKKAE